MRERPEVFRKYDIRGKVPEEIGKELVYHVGQALGCYWDSKEVLVGRDIRSSSEKFYNSIVNGLESQGCKVTLIGLATTDMTALFTRKDFDAGVQITASHMPAEYGGIKPLNSEGRILSNAEMADVKKIYIREEEFSGRSGEVNEVKKGKEYREALEARYNEIFDLKKDLEDLKVVVDPSCSVGDIGLPHVLRSLGAEVVLINSEYDPDFESHPPEPGPDSSAELQEKVVEEEADLGVMLDGDADRVMFVDENGNFLNGNISLALFAKKYLEFSSEIVVSINTSKILEDVVEQAGGSLVNAPVGAVFTALKCLEKGIVFGGQPNGHLMDSEFVPYDSGSLFGLLMTGIIAEQERGLSEMIDELPVYENLSFNYETDRKNEKMLEVREKAKEKDILREEKFDSLKLDFGEFEVLLRPSGSENKIRVHLEAEKIPETAQETVEKFIG